MTANGAGVAVLLAALAAAAPALAHGLGDRYILPVPLSFWIAGAAVVVGLSFVIVETWGRGGTAAGRYPRLNLLRWPAGRFLVNRRLWLAGRACSVALLALIVAAGVGGSQNPTRNLAPTAIWGAWWVGFAYLSAVAGDVWQIVNPWSTLFALVERWLSPRGTPPITYPRALGVWPAVVLFGALAWFELVFEVRAVPAQLALLTLGYSVLTWTGMAIFGRPAWARHADPFAVAFGLLARIAPAELRVTDRRHCRRCEGACGGDPGGCVNCVECFEKAPVAERELNLRPLAAGLSSAQSVSSSVAVFVLLVLATVTFDSFTATPPWSTIESALYPVVPGSPDFKLTAVATVGLMGFAVLFVAMSRAVDRMFVLSLVPIALAYHLAHHFSHLVIHGQLAIPLISDPLGLGWDLVGTADIRPDGGLVDARVAWYAAVVAILAGHILALHVAHAIAPRERPDDRAALRRRLALLGLMVGFTTLSLWIVAQPLVESPGTG
jgi:hypothetical protein